MEPVQRANKVVQDGKNHYLTYHRDTGWVTVTVHGAGEDTFLWGDEPTNRQMFQWLQRATWTCCQKIANNPPMAEEA